MAARRVAEIGLAERLPCRPQGRNPPRRAHHDHLEQAVVGQHRPARRQTGHHPAEVRDDDLRGLGLRRDPIEGDLVGHVPDATARRDGAGKVGKLAPASLRARCRRVHDVGVEADPASHREVVGLPSDGRPSHIDAATHSGENCRCRPIQTAGYPQVARKQVAGPGRNDAEGDWRPGERGGDLADGTVSPDRHHDVAAAFDRPACVAAQIGLVIDDGTVDLPAGPFQRGGDLSHDAVDVAALAPPTDDECCRHGPDSRSRQRLSQSPPSNAAATMINHAAPARRPPTTSVK